MKTILCQTDKEILTTFTVMQQLRQHLHDKYEYVALIKSLFKSENYHLLAMLTENEQCVAVAGYRLKRCLYNSGKIEMYIDDLVTDSKLQSNGYGKQLIVALKKTCRENNYCAMTLHSGLERKRAHQFYRKQNMQHTALHFQWLLSMPE